uniref:Uncharacterized protein n=1 Tax=Ipomoea trifida TaxID=35884 RepID=A0A918_IPOTF|nr:hypothetical protein [Ipomoea trifida]
MVTAWRPERLCHKLTMQRKMARRLDKCPPFKSYSASMEPNSYLGSLIPSKRAQLQQCPAVNQPLC